MSTNIDNGGLPDVVALENLANYFFRSSDTEGLPTPGVLGQQAPPSGYDALFMQGNGLDFAPVATPPSVPSTPYSISPVSTPPSAVGAGISPSALQYVNTIDLGEPGNDNQYNSNGGGRIPASLAGSGASPSVVDGNAVNFNDPQTSLPDENLKTNNSRSVAGDSIFSPAHVLKEYLPFEVEGQSYQAGLEAALSSIFQHTPSTQLPLSAPAGFGISDSPSYYFMEGHSLPVGDLSSQLSGSTYPHVKSSTPPASAISTFGFDANLVKKDFPILSEQVNGKPIVWLDNAATTQKPKQVIDRISYFYEHENSNIHRAAHELAARATDAYEDARKKVQTFIGAASPNEIVFVRGTTEAINLVAKSWGEQYLQAGDEIIVSHLEHHANIVPWQQLAAKKGLKLRVIPVDDDGQVLLDEYAKLLNSKTKIVSFTQVSNALGTVTPAKAIIDMAHHAGAKVLLDGAQSVSHIRTNVQALDADWFVFSGHKVFGPTGIGVLYGKEDLLNATQPWQGGGNMIKDVTFEHTQYHDAPSRFEAGTGNIADAVGLGAALDYVNKLGIDNIYRYEHYLLEYATHLLNGVPGLKLIGTAKDKTSVMSFILDGYTNDQVGQALNQEGIAVRTGHHCAQPILRRFGLESTVRPSLAFYNTCSDIDRLVATLWRLKKVK
ncbi:family 2A encapsulin nanocompartment cargo protein cysteine desulfurase [Parasediminibacterium sp. JCM 36343]|uniref:family 2A encapsulin nanocompartment cargo protein cysteine desulfurase n=1 Tax=Parasediminibacterium sp. JCM 36343 TaxID=3374279 RepID=UPI00397B0D9A